MVVGIDTGPGTDPITATDVEQPERLTDRQLMSGTLSRETVREALQARSSGGGSGGDIGAIETVMWAGFAVVIALVLGSVMGG